MLPFPLTFLCNDFISELFGRNRANMVVWIGRMLKARVPAVLWMGTELPVKPEMVTYGVDALGRTVTGPPIPGVTMIDGQFAGFHDHWTLYRIGS